MVATSYTCTALVKAGNRKWFFLTADYAFGQDLEKDTTNVVVKSGGKVVGSVKHPLNTSDFSSFLLQAQRAKIFQRAPRLRREMIVANQANVFPSQWHNVSDRRFWDVFPSFA